MQIGNYALGSAQQLIRSHPSLTAGNFDQAVDQLHGDIVLCCDREIYDPIDDRRFEVWSHIWARINRPDG